MPHPTARNLGSGEEGWSLSRVVGGWVGGPDGGLLVVS